MLHPSGVPAHRSRYTFRPLIRMFFFPHAGVVVGRVNSIEIQNQGSANFYIPIMGYIDLPVHGFKWKRRVKYSLREHLYTAR